MCLDPFDQKSIYMYFVLKAIPCQALQAPVNGMISPATCTTTASAPNTNCTVSCKTGYSLYGTSTLTCNANGQWSGAAAYIMCQGKSQVYSK